jgi:RNase H-fold protein (predicted Holliday junction resolvase)
MKKYLILFIIFMISTFSVYGEEQKQKHLTRIEVIEKLSASDFLKKKIGDLLNWSVGYDITKINRTNLAPTISWIQATPVKVPPDNRTVVLIVAKVSDPSGLDNIRGVRADLSSIKKLPNMMLVDNGLWGDTKAYDGIYTLQTNVGYDVTKGEKDIPVAVSNKAGWVALGRTNLEVETNPIISELKAVPQAVSSVGKPEVTFSAKVENPGRQEDLKEITIDLRSLGLESSVKMWDDGKSGDPVAGDKIFSVKVELRPGFLSSGTKKLPVKATNIFGGSTDGEITFMVE